MLVEAQVTIDGSAAAIWDAITDVDHAAATISGIESDGFIFASTMRVAAHRGGATLTSAHESTAA